MKTPYFHIPQDYLRTLEHFWFANTLERIAVVSRYLAAASVTLYKSPRASSEFTIDIKYEI